MALQGFPKNTFVPAFEVSIGQSLLAAAVAKLITQVTVTETADPPNSFSFSLYDPTFGLFELAGGLLTEGKEVQIRMGYLGNLTTMIAGEIAAVSVDFPESGPTTFHVEGFDLLHKLTRGTAFRRFDDDRTPDSGLSDSEIVSSIVPSGLTASVDPTPTPSRPREQNNVSDLTFLTDLARTNGYSMWVEAGKLFFKKSRPAPNEIKLERGKTLLSFSPRLSTAGLVKKIEVRGWDPIKKQSFSGHAPQGLVIERDLSASGSQQIGKGSGGDSIRVIEDSMVTSAKEAETLAEAMFSSQLQSLVTGSGSSIGHPDIHVGTILDLRGLGRFNGKYRVTQATHSMGESGYRTSFEVNSSGSGAGLVLSHADDSASSSLRGGTGVRSGLVVDNKDPEGFGRVKVKFPGASESDTGRWSRVATLMAGKERGAFFLPEVGDEVLVAFEYGDVNRTYVLGALWNAEDQPPDKNADGKNNLRFIKSRSGHVVRLDDTDGKEKIEIIDKSGKNSLTFDTANNSVTIKSAKDVSIEAADGTIKLAAKTIQLTASGKIEIKGQGGATLDGSPKDTIVKGKTVNIN